MLAELLLQSIQRATHMDVTVRLDGGSEMKGWGVLPGKIREHFTEETCVP